MAQPPQYPPQQPPPTPQPGQGYPQQHPANPQHPQAAQPPRPGQGYPPQQPPPTPQNPPHYPGGSPAVTPPQSTPPPQPQQPPGPAREASPGVAPQQQAAPRAATPPAPRDKAADDKAKAEAREVSQAASIGAQIILDYNSDAGVGARGGAAGTIEENSAIRDAHLVAIGLDPAAPSGPPTGEPYEPPVVQVKATRHVGPSASKHSSLAAGIQEVPDRPSGNGGSTTTVVRRST